MRNHKKRGMSKNVEEVAPNMTRLRIPTITVGITGDGPLLDIFSFFPSFFLFGYKVDKKENNIYMCVCVYV